MHNHIENVLFSAEEIQAGLQRLGREIEAYYGAESFTVVGVLKGAVVIMADLVRNMSAPIEMAFVGASSYGAGTVSGDVGTRAGCAGAAVVGAVVGVVGVVHSKVPSAVDAPVDVTSA